MAYIVKSPVKGYRGVSAGVVFVDGVGKTENAWVADWLKNRGYSVSEETEDVSVEDIPKSGNSAKKGSSKKAGPKESAETEEGSKKDA